MLRNRLNNISADVIFSVFGVNIVLGVAEN